MKKLLASCFLAVSLLLTPTAAIANDGVWSGYYYCYELDVFQGHVDEWYGDDVVYRVSKYHHYHECYDGTWYYATFMYEWGQGRWVYVG